MTAPRLRIGTRGSALARTQTALVCRALGAAHPELAEPDALEVVMIRTTGDRVTDRPLAELGGKGLFCKELEAALLERRIDLAVHSMKDLPTWLPQELAIVAMLPRADPRDVLVMRAPGQLDDLPQGAKVGSSSIRRRAQLLARRPDLRVVDFRGNVETRLHKLQVGEVDATLLARAGLDRLGLGELPGVVLTPEQMLPAVGQGAIGVECRADDGATSELLAAIDHGTTNICVRTERALLDALDGSCHTPIAGYAELSGERMRLRALIARPDGSECLATERTGTASEGEALGRDAGQELRARAGPGFFD